jgi:hypothetical protein
MTALPQWHHRHQRSARATSGRHRDRISRAGCTRRLALSTDRVTGSRGPTHQQNCSL